MFNIATNLMNRFIIGWPDQEDNFYLRGFINEKGEPIISYRIFDQKGSFIFELRENRFIRGISDYWKKRVGFLSGPGWEIKDELENTIFETETINNITYIIGVLHDNKGNVAAEGDKKRGLMLNCPARLG